MVVTMGRFTGPAEEYAVRLRQNADLHLIDLIAELQPHESSSETMNYEVIGAFTRELQPHESSSETFGGDRLAISRGELQPHESSSETARQSSTARPTRSFNLTRVRLKRPHVATGQLQIRASTSREFV